MHRKPQYLAVLVEIHSQPQSISVHNAHSLDELASPVASIDTADNNLSRAFSCTQDRGVWVILKEIWRERKKLGKVDP